jgi:hypothetical protein
MIRGYLSLFCQSIVHLKAYSDVDTDQDYVNHLEGPALRHNFLRDLKKKVEIKDVQILE